MIIKYFSYFENLYDIVFLLIFVNISLFKFHYIFIIKYNKNII